MNENLTEQPLETNLDDWLWKNAVLGVCLPEEVSKTFKYENYFWTAEETIPEEYTYADGIEYNQGSSLHCTAYAATECMNQIQKKDVWMNPEINPEEVWKAQIKIYPCKGSETGGDYLVSPYQLFQKIGVNWKDPTWKIYTYQNSSYYLIKSTDIETIKQAIFKFWPVTMWWNFNRSIFNTVKETWYMDKLLSDTWKSTFWHAIACIWYNKEWFIIQDSYAWRPHNIFVIKYDRWLDWLKDWTIFWSVIVGVDIKDNWKFVNELEKQLFLDVWYWMYQNDNESYEAIKFVKDNGLMKWNNNKFFPEDTLTRKQLAIVLKRFYNLIQK